MRTALRLTDTKVKGLKPGPTARRLWDGQGLYFEVMPNGRRRWMYKFQLHGRERRMLLGPYPTVTLKAARLAREDAHRLVREGIDPILRRQEVRRERKLASAITLKTIAEEWISQQAAWTAKYAEDVRRSFEQHVYRTLGTIPIVDITPAILQRQVFAPLVQNARLETARRIRQKLELVWNHALLTDRARANAALPLKGTIAAPTVTHFSSAGEHEMPALFVAVRAYGNRLVEHAVLLQALTATRPGETRGARWEEIDFEQALWSVPAHRTKRRRDHLVPLSAQALAILRRLQGISGTGPVLFPSRSRWDVPMSENAVLMVFRRAGFGHVTAHGFRSLFSTVCHEHGHLSHVIEACLAHLDTNATRATYNKAQYLPQRRELLQWWGDRVETIATAYTKKRDLTPIFPMLRSESGPSASGG